MKELVEAAINELRGVFPSATFVETGDGGARVTIPDFLFGEALLPPSGFLGFVLQYQYPQSEVYPFFGPAGIVRASTPDSAIEGLTQGHTWEGHSATQLSIKQRGGWDPNRHTALLAVLSVQNYLRSRA